MQHSVLPHVGRVKLKQGNPGANDTSRYSDEILVLEQKCPTSVKELSFLDTPHPLPSPPHPV